MDGLPERPAAIAPDNLHQRLGELTRKLHDTLRELGYDKSLAEARDHLPDARDRLAYIARLTGNAADTVLNAVDQARGVQDEMAAEGARLTRRWEAVETFSEPVGRATPASRELVAATLAFVASTSASAERTNAILTDIMMAQNFHDLTGQVLTRVATLANHLEEQLLNLLLESSPPEVRRRAEETSGLAGPVVSTEGRTDVVTNQAQVDDLLASLGF